MAHPVKLRVIAGVPKDCNFCLERDSWNGVCEDLGVTVRGSSFEDAKRKMETGLQAHIKSKEGCLKIGAAGKEDFISLIVKNVLPIRR